MTGVPPQAGSGHSPKGGAAKASPAKPSVPNAAFTPGPWHIVFDALNRGNLRVVSFHPAAIAKVYGDKPKEGDEKSAANASLIAAAPELYDAAFEALTLIHNSREVGKAPTNAEAMLTLAIRKARGEQP